MISPNRSPQASARATMARHSGADRAEDETEVGVLDHFGSLVRSFADGADAVDGERVDGAGEHAVRGGRRFHDRLGQRTALTHGLSLVVGESFLPAHDVGGGDGVQRHPAERRQEILAEPHQVAALGGLLQRLTLDLAGAQPDVGVLSERRNLLGRGADPILLGVLDQRAPRRALRVQPQLLGPEPVPGGLSAVGVRLERMGRSDDLPATAGRVAERNRESRLSAERAHLVDLPEAAPGVLRCQGLDVLPLQRAMQRIVRHFRSKRDLLGCIVDDLFMQVKGIFDPSCPDQSNSAK